MIKEFQIGGVKWSVEINNDKCAEENTLGHIHISQAKIYLADKTQGTPNEATVVEQTMYHEVVHAILDTAGYSKLSEDETFVQSFSLLLHQFEKTKK